MRTLKLIHGADFHLDSPFQGLTAAKASMRREEQRQLLRRLAELAQQEAVDLMLLSGDLLDSANTRSETAEELFRWLSQVPCPVIISPGSCDWYSDRSPWARLEVPENVTIFKDQAMHLVSVPSVNARIYGAAFTAKTSPALLKGFHAERKPGFFNLLCIHGEVGNPSSPYNPISEEDLAASGIDYAALGHVHEASGLMRSGGCSYAWPGCPEGRSFEECGTKSVYVVELTQDNCTIRPAEIAVRQYRGLTLDISEKDPLLLIHTSLPDDTVRDIYRITLTGETSKAPNLQKLHQNLDEMFFSLRLRDRTHLSPEIWSGAGEDTLRGLFLSKLRVLYDRSQTDAERFRVEQAVRWGLAAMENGEEVASHENP